MEINLSIVKKFLPLVVGVLVYIGAIAGLIHLRAIAASKVIGIEEDYTKYVERVKSLVGSPPRPSKDDAQRFQRDREVLEAKHKELLARVGATVIPEPSMEPTDFYVYLTTAVGSFTNAAAAAEVKLPEDFDFGFGYYTVNVPGAKKPPAEAKALTGRLGKQLVISEVLGGFLLTNKIEELVAIRRIDVEGGLPNQVLLSGNINAHPGGLYWIMPYELDFYCGAPSLQSLINDFVSAKEFWAVRSVSIQTVAEDGSVVAIESMSRGVAPPSTIAPRTSRIGGVGRFGPSPPSVAPEQPPQRPVVAAGTGGASTNQPVIPKRKRLHVKMRVDYIEFPAMTNQVAAATDGSSAKAGGN
jgi:hypothetical protein